MPIRILGRSTVFRELSDTQLQSVLDAGRVETFPAGAVVFRQTSEDRDLYVVLSGEVEITVDPGLLQPEDRGVAAARVLGRLRAGDSFGEMALLEESTRSASATALVDGTCLVSLSPERLEALCREQPWIGYVVFRSLGAVVSHMVRAQTRATIDAVLRDHFIHALAEDLSSETGYADPSLPLEKTASTHDRESFVLLRLAAGRLREPIEQECFRLLVYSHVGDLWRCFGAGEPSGQQILASLFGILRDGGMSQQQKLLALKKLLDDTDDAVAVEAAWALAQSVDASGAETLAKAASGTDEALARRAIGAMIDLGPKAKAKGTAALAKAQASKPASSRSRRRSKKPAPTTTARSCKNAWPSWPAVLPW